MSDLADHLGARAVRELAAILGGRTIRVPGTGSTLDARRARERLITLVGADLAADLITGFAMQRVYIPRGPSPHNGPGKAISAARVARLSRTLPASAIAARLGCSERTIYRKRAQHRALTTKRKGKPA